MHLIGLVVDWTQPRNEKNLYTRIFKNRKAKKNFGPGAL